MSRRGDCRWLLPQWLLFAILVSLAGCGGGERAAGPPSDEPAATESQADLSSTDGNAADQLLEAGSNVPQEPIVAPAVEPRSRRIPVLDGPSVPTSPSPRNGELTFAPPIEKGLPNQSVVGRRNPASMELPSIEGFVFGEEPASEEAPVAFAESQEEGDSMAESNETAGTRKSVKTLATQKLGIAAETVEVFFATDRRPTGEVLPSMFRTFLPALAVGAICVSLAIGLSMAKRFQLAWIMGTALATCLGVTVFHVSIIRWQEYSRLAAGNSTRFSTLRYHPAKGAYPLHVGVASVSVPHVHQKGVIEAPKIARFEFKESPDKHIMLQRVEVHQSADSWFEQLSRSTKSPSEQDGFVFIHGYNVRFGDALKRTAQLATDLEVNGPIISYSWPSRGQLSAYPIDEASVEWTGPNLERFLADLAAKTSIRRFNVVAHSMGNRALLDSIERIHLKTSGNGNGLAESQPQHDVQSKHSHYRIGALVLAAPDVDAHLFANRYQEAIEQVAERAVLYFTRDDLALTVSSKLHSTPRLGLGSLDSESSLMAIDTGAQGVFSLGHSYYGSDPAVIDDIRRVLVGGEVLPSGWLRPARTQSGVDYWKIDRRRYAQTLTEVSQVR